MTKVENMKTLKFRKNLSKLILNGEKYVTWRLFDDKNITPGDIVSLLVWETKNEFAKAKILDIREKKLGDLEEEDWEGHEKFESDEEMYKEFSMYYKREVGPDDIVKIIKFELI